MQKLIIARDGSNSVSYAINLAASSDVYDCALLADTATSVSVPAGARIAIFGYAVGCDYYLSTATFTLPAGNSFTASNIYLNPPPCIVTGISALWFRAPVACKISVAFYG